MLPYPHHEGQPVTYHGSTVELHGRPLRAWVCVCRSAHPVDQPRFTLTGEDGQIVAQHARPQSLDAA